MKLIKYILVCAVIVAPSGVYAVDDNVLALNPQDVKQSEQLDDTQKIAIKQQDIQNDDAPESDAQEDEGLSRLDRLKIAASGAMGKTTQVMSNLAKRAQESKMGKAVAQAKEDSTRRVAMEVAWVVRYPKEARQIAGKVLVAAGALVGVTLGVYKGSSWVYGKWVGSKIVDINSPEFQHEVMRRGANVTLISETLKDHNANRRALGILPQLEEKGRPLVRRMSNPDLLNIGTVPVKKRLQRSSSSSSMFGGVEIHDQSIFLRKKDVKGT